MGKVLFVKYVNKSLHNIHRCRSMAEFTTKLNLFHVLSAIKPSPKNQISLDIRECTQVKNHSYVNFARNRLHLEVT